MRHLMHHALLLHFSDACSCDYRSFVLRTQASNDLSANSFFVQNILDVILEDVYLSMVLEFDFE